MAGNLRPTNGDVQGISQALRGQLGSQAGHAHEQPQKLVLTNRAGESKSPYVRAHASNPVAWQVWGDEAIALAKKENRLLFVSIGYSACHCEFSAILSSVPGYLLVRRACWAPIDEIFRVPCYGARVLRE